MGTLSTPVPAERNPAEHKQSGHEPSRVALIGVHGFGAHHLQNLERLQANGVVRLVAVADPNPPAPGALPPGTAVFSNLDELLAGTPALDLVIVATPIQTHAQLALTTLPHADLYLEKPPVASLADFNRLQEAATAAGRIVQVGFQSLGSRASRPLMNSLRRERSARSWASRPPGVGCVTAPITNAHDGRVSAALTASTSSMGWRPTPWPTPSPQR
ncbi:hypothetical protein AHiyo8_28390 [Arthrobacter sp. Hiyo8]|nr:hypothetical protein AHiyo8_28390 [Arthrobacter sp. Hiyo8]